jgi:hypothetical protein
MSKSAPLLLLNDYLSVFITENINYVYKIVFILFSFIILNIQILIMNYLLSEEGVISLEYK